MTVDGMKKQPKVIEVVITPEARSNALRTALRNSPVKTKMTANQRRALAAAKQQRAKTA